MNTINDKHVALSWARLGTISLLVLTLFSGQGHVEAASSGNTLFFYNPETNINDFRSLKKQFDRYLSAKGAFRFQPFKSQNTFEFFMKRRKNAVFLLSSWHYQSLVEQGRFNLKPILVGTVDGASTYTKVLTTKKNVRSLKQLQGKRIASAGNRDYTEKTLKSMAAQKRLRTHKPFNVRCQRILMH
jgi:hypothetical protein